MKKTDGCPGERHGQEAFAYSVVRSGRRTVEIGVSRDGEVRVRAPYRMTDDKIHAWVLTKRDWVLQKRGEILRHRAAAMRGFVSGEEFPYLGKKYILEVFAGGEARPEHGPAAGPAHWRAAGFDGCPAGRRGGWVRLLPEEGRLVVCTAPGTIPDGAAADAATVRGNAADETAPNGALAAAEVRRLLLRWYGDRLLEYLDEKIEYYGNLLGEKPARVRVRDMSSRWGSCSAGRNLSFNRRLIMAEPRVVDYVIVHELCHLKQMNHSRAFWDLVGGILPDYRERRRLLKIYEFLDLD